MQMQLNHEEVRITEKKRVCKDTVTIELDSDVDADPGQFFMLYLPEMASVHPRTQKKLGKEKPFTVSGVDPLQFTIRQAGPFTEMVQGLTPRRTIQVTGPLGNGYRDLYNPKTPNHYLIAGGCGAAGFGYLAKMLYDPGRTISSFVGARDADNMLLPEELVDFSNDMKVAIEKGSTNAWVNGTVLDLVNDADIDPDGQAYVCGPRKMLIAVADELCQGKGLNPDMVVLAIEPYMKCGRGVCGSCEVDGYHVCVDGPNFRYSDLADAKDFMEYRREKSGKLIEL